jgi:hypothetical protein
MVVWFKVWYWLVRRYAKATDISDDDEGVFFVGYMLMFLVPVLLVMAIRSLCS